MADPDNVALGVADGSVDGKELVSPDGGWDGVGDGQLIVETEVDRVGARLDVSAKVGWPVRDGSCVRPEVGCAVLGPSI